MDPAPDIPTHAADLAIVRDLAGLYLAMLSEAEMQAFNRLCDAGLAYRCAAESGGLLSDLRVAVQDDLFEGGRE